MEKALALRLQAMQRAGGFSPQTVRDFGDWILKADDPDLYRINLVSWARQRGMDEDDALRLFLHATKVGIFELSWGVICSHCGVLITTPGGLRALGPTPHCKLCRVDVSGFLDDAVEAVFSVEPAVRKLRYHDRARIDLKRDLHKLFFSPSCKPNAFHDFIRHGVQTGMLLDTAESGLLELDATRAGVYAIIAPTVHAIAFLSTVEDGPSELLLECLDGQFMPSEATVGQGPVRIRVRNRSDYLLPTVGMFLGGVDDVHADPIWEYDAYLTGKRLLTNQTFRDLFRTETIGDKGLHIKNLAIVFTDLQASTALYERVGDLRALELVRKHFELLENVVVRHRGAVVKTIGDAVMAAFGEPERALAAAAGMTRAVGRINADGDALTLKIGLHAGSCIAIQTNNQIDYFGRAVNIAARVQSVARGGEIVVTEAIWDCPGIPELVLDYGLQATEDRVSLRGIAEDVHVHRLA